MILSIDDKNVICGIHTATITSSKKATGVASESQMFTYSGFDEKNRLYSYIVNIEKLDVGANKSIITLTDFLKRLSSNYGLSDVSIKRIDFRIDFFNVEYEDYFKPFLLICIMLSNLRAKSNTFVSVDAATWLKKTVRVNDSRFECEYYNKLIQNPRLGIPARIEFRCKGMDVSIDDTSMIIVIKKILMRLSKNITKNKYDKSIEYLNKCISNNLNEEKCDWWTPNQRPEFMRKNSIRIFTRSQIANLCNELGYKNPVRQADSFLSLHRTRNVTSDFGVTEWGGQIRDFNLISWNEIKGFTAQLVSIILDFSKDLIVNSSEEKEEVYKLCSEWLTKKHIESILNPDIGTTKNL